MSLLRPRPILEDGRESERMIGVITAWDMATFF